MGILDNLTPDQIAAFSKEQLVALVTASHPAQTPTLKHTLLQESHRLTSSNWLEFKSHFPALLTDQGLWTATSTTTNKDGTSTIITGGPLSTLSAYTLSKNIVDKHLSKLVTDCSSASEGWTKLLQELDRKTVPAKVKALTELTTHIINRNTNIPKACDRHSDIKARLNTAFGPTITLDSLADFIFLTSVKDYDFQTNTHKSTESFEFSKFKIDLEIAYDNKSHNSKIPAAKKAISKDSGVQGCPNHKTNHWFEGSCRRCNPCTKCTADGMKFTWHANNSPSCESSQKSALKADIKTDSKSGQVPSSKMTRAVTFIADSGNTDPIINNKGHFEFYHESRFTHVELAGTGQSMDIEGAGSLRIATPQGVAVMKDVLYCPTSTDNLLSISRLDDKGLSSVFCDGIFTKVAF